MTDNPFAPSRMNVSVKVPESKRYANDNPWFTFEGQPEFIRQQVIETFGLEETDGLTLFDVVLNAQRVASNLGGAAQNLGGKVINEGDKESSSKSDSKPAEDEDPLAPLRAEIENVKDRDALKKLWAENKATFDANADLFAEWKAKGKSLPS